MEVVGVTPPLRWKLYVSARILRSCSEDTVSMVVEEPTTLRLRCRYMYMYMLGRGEIERT